MIINSAPQNEAVLSNVGEIGEFRIRNSAKAFSILSSGLYANKIRAIIRELSCNAVDSHTAANKSDVPFEVHLPNALAPHFSIRDFGTGLSHEQVTQIYTTYFESTKTASNDFIGALGLGSKSPFSYTDNFTVTAIKDGKKGIYSAFINGEGVPSIALMMSEDTDEPSGVEIKFSVNDQYDYSRFREEARSVYQYFKLVPNVIGSDGFQVNPIEYDVRDIIPGVHTYSNKGYRQSVAVMGNIAYPIDVPNQRETLGDLYKILQCNLEMHFEIGELDFQASREGLSYIPATIQAIKRKLEAVRAQLTIHLTEEANKLDNLWDRAVYLADKDRNELWNESVASYLTTNPIPTMNVAKWNKLETFKLDVDELVNNFNIVVRGFNKDKHNRSVTTLKSNSDCVGREDGGLWIYRQVWNIDVNKNTHFCLNDTKVGGSERAKYHYRESEQDCLSQTFFVLEPANRDVAMDTVGFFNAISNPPANRIFNVSALTEKPRKESSALGKNVSLMKLEKRATGSYNRDFKMVWANAGDVTALDTTKTYYYVPLKGFNIQSNYVPNLDIKQLYTQMDTCGVPELRDVQIYGVRKDDLEYITKQSNWVNVEDYIVQCLENMSLQTVLSIAKNNLTTNDYLEYNSNIISKVDEDSPYRKLVEDFRGVNSNRTNEHTFKVLVKDYGKNLKVGPSQLVEQYSKKCEEVVDRYPLLQYLRYAPDEEVARYINIIDKKEV